jgi:peptidoglycan/xylan/chitin deacetylase (PgdA/CDA1 family)
MKKHISRAPLMTTIAWKLRSMLSSNGRKRARLIADYLMAPLFGSINGVLGPSQAVALTFDDGPDPTVTSRLLDLLHDRGVHATFFVLTDKVAMNPDLVRRMAAEGHEIALHADRHERLTLFSVRETTHRILFARDSLQRVVGRPVRFFRPPFGAQSLFTYLAVRACRLEIVVWGPYAEDWIPSSPEAVARRALKDLNPGDVLLLHDGLEIPAGQPIPTFDRIRAFELILDGMEDLGLRPVTVGELISASKPRRIAWFRP